MDSEAIVAALSLVRLTTAIGGVFYAIFGSGPDWLPVNGFMRFGFRLFFPDVALMVWGFRVARNSLDQLPHKS